MPSLFVPDFISASKPIWWNCSPSQLFTLAAANSARGSFVTVAVPTLISNARIYCSVQNGNISIAVYTADGATRLATTGAVACPAAGIANIPFTTPVFLERGVYFVALSGDNAVAQFSSGSNQQGSGASANAASHPCPAALVTDNNSAGSVVSVGLW